jgi:hypothetical protein
MKPDERQPIARVLHEAGPLEVEHLVEILLIDQGERWQRGKAVTAEEYLRWFPHLADNPEQAPVLVYGEYVLREELGRAPEPAEFVSRFPQYAARFEQ